jgi:hypothetical protein
VVEGFNAFDVVTADRVVGQIATEHPLVGYVPKVTFLGTRFENLRIAGHPVRLELDLDILGPKPDNDAPYSKAPGFIDSVTKQHAGVRAHPNLLTELLDRYTGLTSIPRNPESIDGSLVNEADGTLPGRCFGHVIEVPHFGTVVLAALRLGQSDYDTKTGIPKCTTIELTMIELKLGCLAHGNAQTCAMHVGGRSKP